MPRNEAHRLRYNSFMTEYRRFYQPNATWFFTVNLAERKNNRLLVDNIDLLRECFRYVKQRKPYHVDAIVILPDHLHCIWTLPPDDNNYSVRWNMLKGRFSRAIEKGERISVSRLNRRERGIWQRRFWEHTLHDEQDYQNHFDYLHFNPVKHGLVDGVSKWPYSSFHYWVKQGVYTDLWGSNIEEFESLMKLNCPGE